MCKVTSARYRQCHSYGHASADAGTWKAKWKGCSDGVRGSLFTYAAAVLHPDGVLDPFLAVGVEGVGHGLLDGEGADELGLEFFDHLHCVQGHVLERTHHGALSNVN